MREPDFDGNLKKVLLRRRPNRPTLFEFIVDRSVQETLAGFRADPADPVASLKMSIRAFYNAGYDYVPCVGSAFHFLRGAPEGKESYSINEGGLIRDRESFDRYRWNEPEDFPDILEQCQGDLPAGMKYLVYGHDGVLENVIGIVGYETLCYLLADDPALVKDIFDHVGSRLLRYYERYAQMDSVGVLLSNDDWGYKHSTMLSPADLRSYVFPWHRQIAEAAHRRDKLVALHSCGMLEDVFSDICADMRFDGKHSYEDAIEPVEQAYERRHKDIAVLGGIDVDFLCRAEDAAVERRCREMLERGQDGGYALGTGNSIARYVPLKKYLILLKCVNPEIAL